jgi:hypothetical protein
MRVRIVIALMAVVGLGAACSVINPPEPHAVEFAITGDAELTNIVYTVNGKSVTVDHPKLPWNLTLKLRPPYAWKLKVTSTSGSESTEVRDNGGVVTAGSSSGGGTSNYGGSLG